MKKLVAALVVLASSVTFPARAEVPSLVKKFYEAKKASTTPEAYRRAAGNLERVQIGMSERRFLSSMQMEVLAKARTPVDARIDGYLQEASKRANQMSNDGTKQMIFGYIAGGREVVKARVALREHVVVVVERLDTAIASNGSAGGSIN